MWTTVLLYLFSLLNKGRVRKSKRALPQFPGTWERLTGVGAEGRLPGDVRGESGSSNRPTLSCSSRSTSGKSPGNRREKKTGERQGYVTEVQQKAEADMGHMWEGLHLK